MVTTADGRYELEVQPVLGRAIATCTRCGYSITCSISTVAAYMTAHDAAHPIRTTEPTTLITEHQP